MSPPVPTSEVTEAIRRCSATSVAQVVLEPVAPSRWRTMHATWIWCIAKTIALAPQRRPSSKQAARDRLERDAAAAELAAARAPRARLLLAQRVDRLVREARVAVDVVGVGRRDLVGDPADRREERLVDARSTVTLMHSPHRCRAGRARSEIDGDALEDAALVSISSGNSTSNSSSSASITLTLACEVMPAW